MAEVDPRRRRERQEVLGTYTEVPRLQTPGKTSGHRVGGVKSPSLSGEGSWGVTEVVHVGGSGKKEKKDPGKGLSRRRTVVRRPGDPYRPIREPKLCVPPK